NPTPHPWYRDRKKNKNQNKNKSADPKSHSDSNSDSNLTQPAATLGAILSESKIPSKFLKDFYREQLKLSKTPSSKKRVKDILSHTVCTLLGHVRTSLKSEDFDERFIEDFLKVSPVVTPAADPTYKG